MKNFLIIGGVLLSITVSTAVLQAAHAQSSSAQLYLNANATDRSTTGETSGETGANTNTNASVQYKETDLDFIQAPATSNTSTNSANSGSGTGDPDRPVIIGQPARPDTERKESEEKGGTEDINIGVGELQEDEPGTETEDRGYVSSGTTYVAAGYVKISDIKGESTEQAGNSNSNTNTNSNTNSGKGGSKGNVEFEWKVEEGESGKPADREITGEGDADSDTSRLTLTACEGVQAICEASLVRNEDELREFLQRSVNEYDELEKIEVQQRALRLHTFQRARLLGFIPLRMKQTVEIETDADTLGRVSVKFPWWSFFAAKTVKARDLSQQVTNALNELEVPTWQAATNGSADDRPTESITLNFAQVKALLHDSAMSVIRKVGG